MKRYNNPVMDNARWQDFHPRPDDVFVCTPPKCGTTWTQAIVCNLLWPDGNLPAPVAELSPWLEFKAIPKEAVLGLLAGQTHRRVIKSHTPADGIPWYDECKYIFVCRDGKDAFMSMVNHVERLKLLDAFNEQAINDGLPPLPKFDGNYHNFLVRWLEDDEIYFHHLASFWALRDKPNLLFVHYNNLKADLPGEVRRIASFLGNEVEDQEIERVAERCTFENMRSDETMMGNMSYIFEGGLEGFFFKGTNGRWRDVLTDEDLKLYDAKVEASLTPECAKWASTGELQG